MKSGQVHKKLWIRFLTWAELLISGHYRWRSKSPRIYLVFWQAKILLSQEECCMRVFSSLGNTWHVPCCFCSVAELTCSCWICCPGSMALMLWFRVVGSQRSDCLTGQDKLITCGHGAGLNQQAQPGQACSYGMQQMHLHWRTQACQPQRQLAGGFPVLEARRGKTWAVLYQLVVGPENAPKHVWWPSMKVNNQYRALPVPQVKVGYQKA